MAKLKIPMDDNGHVNCPIQDLLARIGDKWSLLIIAVLSHAENRTLRFSELMRKVSGISQRMLTTTLRNLERDGVVTRHIYPEIPPRVEYQLTELGMGLTGSVTQLIEWIETRWSEIEIARKHYDAQNPPKKN